MALFYAYVMAVMAEKMPVLTTLWCSCLLLLGSVSALPAQVPDGVTNWQDLLDGEVVSTPVRNAEGLPGVRALFTVRAPRQRIWSVLVDYEHFLQIFPNLSKVRLLSQNDRGARVEYWAEVVLFSLHYVLDRHYVEPGRRLTWVRVSGDLKRIEGAWEIRDTPRPGTQLLVYESYVQAGGLIPASLVRQSAVHQTQQMCEHLRAWIEGRVVAN